MCTGQNSIHFETKALHMHYRKTLLILGYAGQVITAERLLGTVLLYRRAMLCTSHCLDHMTDHVIMIMIYTISISIFLHSLTFMLHGLGMRLDFFEVLLLCPLQSSPTHVSQSLPPGRQYAYQGGLGERQSPTQAPANLQMSPTQSGMMISIVREFYRPISPDESTQQP